jgi:hypothetical protein
VSKLLVQSVVTGVVDIYIEVVKLLQSIVHVVTMGVANPCNSAC